MAKTTNSDDRVVIKDQLVAKLQRSRRPLKGSRAKAFESKSSIDHHLAKEAITGNRIGILDDVFNTGATAAVVIDLLAECIPGLEYVVACPLLVDHSRNAPEGLSIDEAAAAVEQMEFGKSEDQ